MVMAMELNSIVVSFSWTPSFAPFAIIIIIYCWACVVGFNKENEKEFFKKMIRKKKMKRRKRERPCDKSSGLFFDGFLFFHTTNSKV